LSLVRIVWVDIVSIHARGVLGRDSRTLALVAGRNFDEVGLDEPIIVAVRVIYSVLEDDFFSASTFLGSGAVAV
jgi:hypothetical protein